MRSRIPVAAVALLLAVAPAARATVSAGAGSFESVGFYHQSYDPDTNVWSDGSLYVYRLVGVGVEDASAAPGLVVKATAWWTTCDEQGCDGGFYPLQNVAATALSFDPIGNAPSFSECLTPTSGPCEQFDIEFSRPGSLMVSGCGSVPVCANAWHAQDSASASAGTGLWRSGYQVSGTFAGSTFVPPASDGFLDANSWRSLGADAEITG